MKVERRNPTAQEWRSITSSRGGRRGVKATPGILRALEDKRGKGEALRGEAGERAVDRFIEHRSRQFGAEEANERARQQAQAERERVEDRRDLTRELWRRHHQRLAAVHSRLAREHQQRLERLTSSRNGGTP